MCDHVAEIHKPLHRVAGNLRRLKSDIARKCVPGGSCGADLAGERWKCETPLIGNQCHCCTAHSVLVATDAVLGLGVSEVRDDLLAPVGSVQRLATSRAYAAAGKTVLNVEGTEQNAAALTEGNLDYSHGHCRFELMS
ncbi:hypothetical protein D9M68_472440 [compost metagenome]